MQNNLNIKSTHNPLKIVIKLSKINENYSYLSDTLNESHKIKIPIDSLGKKEKTLPPKKSNIIQYRIPKKVEDSDSEIELEPEIKVVIEKLDQAKTQQVIIPTCSQWFSIDDIHEIEMNSLPEFFCGKYPSKSPQNYKEYRNFIISLYRENPGTYLSSTSKYKISLYILK